MSSFACAANAQRALTPHRYYIFNWVIFLPVLDLFPGLTWAALIYFNIVAGMTYVTWIRAMITDPGDPKYHAQTVRVAVLSLSWPPFSTSVTTLQVSFEAHVPVFTTNTRRRTARLAITSASASTAAGGNLPARTIVRYLPQCLVMVAVASVVFHCI